jgi:hypothetical protein
MILIHSETFATQEHLMANLVFRVQAPGVVCERFDIGAWFFLGGGRMPAWDKIPRILFCLRP